VNQIQVIDALAWGWLVLAGLATAYVAWDQFRHSPEALVMKCGWVLVTLYMGPIGLALYVMSDKEPAPGTHEEFIKPLWKQGVGSTVHGALPFAPRGLAPSGQGRRRAAAGRHPSCQSASCPGRPHSQCVTPVAYPTRAHWLLLRLCTRNVSIAAR
jgi:hypothetical protein